MPRTPKSTRDIIVRAPSLSAARRFYERTLGLKPTTRTRTLLCYETGSFTLYVERGEPNGAVHEFLVDDLPRAKVELLSAGCTFVEEDPRLPRCYVRDPFGLVFNLRER